MARAVDSSEMLRPKMALVESSGQWFDFDSDDGESEPSPKASRSGDARSKEDVDSTSESQAHTAASDAYMIGGIDLLRVPWFHPDATRHQAEAVLQQADPGTYLMRPSYNRTSGALRGFTVDLKCKSAVKHYMMSLTKNRIVFGQEQFKNVDSLLKHFSNCPVVGDDEAKMVVFQHPYPRVVDQFSDYQFVSTHFVYGKDKAVVERQRTSFSLASKEGYLTKLGAVVKSWKRRWFVLKDEELSYFLAENQKKPIRCLNLRNIIEVTSTDDIPGKANIFKLVMPARTFFLQASSPEVKEDWMFLLQWKMKEIQELRSPEDMSPQEELDGFSADVSSSFSDSGEVDESEDSICRSHSDSVQFAIVAHDGPRRDLNRRS